MGLFDKKNNNKKDDKISFWGDWFDFNGDGKITLDEEYIIYKSYKAWEKSHSKNRNVGTRSSRFDYYDDEDESTEWRENYDIDPDTGLDPEDFDTEEEYEEALEAALEDAKTEWRENYDIDPDTGLDPEDFETEEEYEEALELAYEDYDDEEEDTDFEYSDEDSEPPPVLDDLDRLNAMKEEDYPNKRQFDAAYILANVFTVYLNKDSEELRKSACRFILDNADKIIAANYLTADYGFLYARAIKDNFTLPCSLPDEDEKPQIHFHKILIEIAKYDIPLAFEIWKWCLKQFLPYEKYDRECKCDLSVMVIDSLYRFPDGFITKLVHYMNEHNSFLNMFLSAYNETADYIEDVIAQAIQEELFDTAKSLFETAFDKAADNADKINSLILGIIYGCENYEELESMEYFKEHLLPSVKAKCTNLDGLETEKWAKEIDNYIDEVESTCEKYEYSRKNAWRNNVPQDDDICIFPNLYDSEQEYLAAYYKEKYRWRDDYKNIINIGLNAKDYENEDDFLSAYSDIIYKIKQKKIDRRIAEIRNRQKEREKPNLNLNDKSIYKFCGVVLPFSEQAYSYITDDETIKVGDMVIVPVGKEQKEMNGNVVSVCECLRSEAPFPVEKAKKIIKKITDE